MDDDLDDIDLFREALEVIDKDVELVTAHSGRQALDLLFIENIRPDHIFLDINMPIMNGMECLEELTMRTRIPPPQVTIYTTSENNFKGYQRCIELGADYLRKPHTYEGLIESLKNQLGVTADTNKKSLHFR